MNADRALERLTADPSRTGVFCDFDGTLSVVVDHPDAAEPAPGAVRVMERLAAAFRVVGVISGRSLEDLRARFDPEGAVLAGAYGREKSDRPLAVATRDWGPVADATTTGVHGWDGVLVEQKDSGVAIHYRLAPARGDDVVALAGALAARFGLEVRRGRMVAELTEPGPGKGEALSSLVDEYRLSAFLFAGDDLADAEAFRWARSSSHSCVLVGVRSDEAPAAIERDADIVVDAPTGLVRLLDLLAERVRRPD